MVMLGYNDRTDVSEVSTEMTYEYIKTFINHFSPVVNAGNVTVSESPVHVLTGETFSVWFSSAASTHRSSPSGLSERREPTRSWLSLTANWYLRSGQPPVGEEGRRRRADGGGRKDSRSRNRQPAFWRTHLRIFKILQCCLWSNKLKNKS